MMKVYCINPNFDRDELKRLLTEFVEANGKAETIAKEIERQVLIKQYKKLKPETLVQFSKWCNTNIPYSGENKKGGQQIAEKISILLFREIIPRMGDKIEKEIITRIRQKGIEGVIDVNHLTSDDLRSIGINPRTASNFMPKHLEYFEKIDRGVYRLID